MPGAAQIGPWSIALAAILVHSLTGANTNGLENFRSRGKRKSG